MSSNVRNTVKIKFGKFCKPGPNSMQPFVLGEFFLGCYDQHIKRANHKLQIKRYNFCVKASSINVKYHDAYTSSFNSILF